MMACLCSSTAAVDTLGSEPASIDSVPAEPVGIPLQIVGKQLHLGIDWQFLVSYSNGATAWHGREGQLLVQDAARPIGSIDPRRMDELVTAFNITPKAKLKTVRFGQMGFAVPIITMRKSRFSLTSSFLGSRRGSLRGSLAGSIGSDKNSSPQASCKFSRPGKEVEVTVTYSANALPNDPGLLARVSEQPTQLEHSNSVSAS
eukprot:CAMPEP_0174718440 /NCGR_PEP_ID=MMETSP1094-20130205/28934_1 /TAXON_ID=156173 /ORGANISM="Chrysochromulina brevifilum, Strain UTEX LB 985" /LENGTH=201 /DNA_ID=CAMNT_0015918541 /DNA_START=15 /DNA_END=620 /DNA_ORIENTATION=+